MSKKSIYLKHNYKQNKDSYIVKRYIRFGKFDLNHYQLNENNILLVKYPKSRGPVAKLKSTKVSNNFKSLIHDLIDTQKINKAIQKKLNTKEMDLFELLITKSANASGDLFLLSTTFPFISVKGVASDCALKMFTLPITNSITEALNHILRVMYFCCNFHKIFFTYLKIKF